MRTASAAYALKIMTLTRAHSLPRDTLVYRVLGSFCMLDRVCVESICVPSSEYAFKNLLSATIAPGLEIRIPEPGAISLLPENCSWTWSISLCTILFENQEHFTTQQVQICSFAPAISRLA